MHHDSKDENSKPRKITKLESKRWLLTHGYTSFNRHNIKIAHKAIREKERNRKRKGADITFTEPAADSQAAYGRVRLGGTITYAQVSNNNKYLMLVITLCAHDIKGIRKVIIDDIDVPFSVDGDGIINSNTSSAPWIEGGESVVKIYPRYSGTSAISQLITDSGGAWTSNHRQIGYSHVYMRLKYSELFFPNGLPEIKFEIDGKILTSTPIHEFSRNPAYIISDYLFDGLFGASRRVGKFQIGQYDNDFEGSDEAIDICDELVPLAVGGSETRYTCDLVFSTGESINSVIDQILSSFGGYLRMYDGNFYDSIVLAPKHRTSVFTLTEKDFLADISIQTVEPIPEAVQALAGTFVDASAGYVEADFPAYVANPTTYQWNLRDSIQLHATTSRSMAQRLAKLNLLRRQKNLRIQCTVPLYYWLGAPGDVFKITLDRLNWSEKEFEIEAIQMVFLGSASNEKVLAVVIDGRETDSTIYDWTVAEELSGTLPVQPDFPTPGANGGTSPTDLILQSGDGEIPIAFVQGDGSVVARILASWTAPEDAFVSSGGVIDVEFKLSSSAVWNSVGTVSGNTTEIYINDVQIGSQYDVRVRGRTAGGVVGSWVTALHYTVLGPTAPPSDVSSFIYTVVGGNVSLTWNPVPQANIVFYRIKKTTSAQPWETCTLVAEQLGQPVIADNTGSPTFKIKAVNSLGIESQNATDAVLYVAPGSGSSVGLLLGLTQA